MDNETITGLAREYAEDLTRRIRKMDGELPNCLLKEALSVAKDDAEDVIRFLLRRYCLVEKENIKKYFQSRNYILAHQDEYAVYIVRESEVEMRLLHCLFPEIAKEMEG